MRPLTTSTRQVCHYFESPERTLRSGGRPFCVQVLVLANNASHSQDEVGSISSGRRLKAGRRLTRKDSLNDGERGTDGQSIALGALQVRNNYLPSQVHSLPP
jgi:hypothetical protein